MVCRLRRNVEYCALGIFLIYVPINVFYLIGIATKEQSRTAEIPLDLVRAIKPEDSSSNFAYPVKIKDLVPNGENAVDVILTVDRDKFVEAIDATILGSFRGEFTNNPLPISTTFLMANQYACKDIPNLQYIIYVHSAPLNWQKRKFIRLSWASNGVFKEQKTKLVFLLGKPDNPNDQIAIEREQYQFSDIVQGNFKENYKNLTLKAIMGLKWVSEYCKEAAFAIKADDDAFINIFQLIDVIERNRQFNRMIICPVWKEHTMLIMRDPSKCSKWCVQYDEFPGRKFFPRYCAGLGYVMSREIIPELYRASLATPFFWIDDVYVTGMLTPKVRDIKFIDILDRFALNVEDVKEQFKKTNPLKYIMAHVKFLADSMELWNSSLSLTTESELVTLGDEVFKNFPHLINQKPKGITVPPGMEVVKPSRDPNSASINKTGPPVGVGQASPAPTPALNNKTEPVVENMEPTPNPIPALNKTEVAVENMDSTATPSPAQNKTSDTDKEVVEPNPPPNPPFAPVDNTDLDLNLKPEPEIKQKLDSPVNANNSVST